MWDDVIDDVDELQELTKQMEDEIQGDGAELSRVEEEDDDDIEGLSKAEDIQSDRDSAGTLATEAK